MTDLDLTPEQDEHLRAPVVGQLEVPVDDELDRLGFPRNDGEPLNVRRRRDHRRPPRPDR